MLYFESTDFLLELPRRILLQISEWHIGRGMQKLQIHMSTKMRLCVRLLQRRKSY